MAVKTTGASSWADASGTPPVSALPLTIACWFKDDSSALPFREVFSLFGNGTYLTPSFEIFLGSGSVLASAIDDTATVDASSSTAYSTGTWYSAVGVFNSTTSRTLYLNGAAATTDTTAVTFTGANLVGPSAFDGVYTKAYGGASTDAISVAEAAIWNVALDANEIAALAKGFSPQLIRPGSLKTYFPFIRETVTSGSNIPYRYGGQTLAVTGSGLSIVDHPRIIYPRHRNVANKSAAAAITGALAVTEARDALSFTGKVISSGSLSVTEARDTAAFVGNIVTTITGTMAITESADVPALSGGIFGSGALAVTEARDTVAFSGAVISLGPLSVVETPDAALFSGAVISLGPLAATESRDTAAFSGAAYTQGALAVTESPDTLSLSGLVFSGVTGVVAIVENQDAAALSGSVIVVGTLSATEQPDIVALSGRIPAEGSLIVIESSDIVSIDGNNGDIATRLTLTGVGR